MVKKSRYLREEDLIEALKSKEMVAYQVLNDIYAPKLLKVAKGVLKSDDAEDSMQEIMIKIWNSAHKYDSSKGKLYTWMLNITRNHTIDILRSKKFRNASKDLDLETCIHLVDAEKNISINVETIDIKNLTLTLKWEWKEPLDMVFFQGYTHAEAAERLNLPLGTLKTRLRMAVVELRKRFDE